MYTMLGLVLLTVLPGQFPVVKSDEFPAKLQESALAATVRVLNLNSKSEGTGVIIYNIPVNYTYILTAGHVVKDGTYFKVSLFNAKTYPKPSEEYMGERVQLLARREGVKDLALMRIAAVKELPAIPLYKSPRDPKGRDFLALTAGCSDGAPPTCQIEKILRAGLFSREEKGEQGKCWEAAKAQTPGRSGGPLLDKEGRLIGLCSGNNREERGYFCHISEIDAFLQATDFRWLLKEPRPKTTTK
jgi:S1-C subfamily serine protease